MAADDDDWVGTPPEGHHPASKSKPSYWDRLPAAHLAGAGLLIVVIIGIVLIVIFT